MMTEHRCSNCWVAQYGMKSDIVCRNEWWTEWDSLMPDERWSLKAGQR